ncbi:MAG: peptide deformylase [Chitinophagales bacterium]|nr:peptide deformylase [Chitinophagales bacterium]
MILPIIVYGSPILKQKASEIDAEFENLAELIQNMWQTMYQASGIGLAAPQINKSIRLFIVDTAQLEDRKKDEPNFVGIKKVFINPQITEEIGAEWKYEEGCLSIPGIRENVERKPDITITYQDEQFNTMTESYSGLNARVIQHEYDHIEGVLFTDKVKPLTKKLIQSKLNKIMRGDFRADYKTKSVK